jgi:hypothetical protein
VRITLLFPAVTLTYLLAACGGGSNSDPSATATPTPTIDFRAEAQRIVPDALLTVDDLPGFETQDVGALEEQADLTVRCNIFSSQLVFPAAEATAESDPYVGPGDQQAFNHAAVYRTTADASAGITGTQEILDRCEDEFRETVERIAKEELDRLGIDLGFFAKIDVTIGNYDPPPAGDELLGYRLNVTVDLVATKQQYNLDVIFVREGRVVSALMLGGFGVVHPEAEASLLEKSTVKLAAAEEALPE